MFPATTVNGLIRYAFQLDSNSFYSQPSWMELDAFDIEAKADRPVSLGELRQMLQSMMEDRFRLKLHHETKSTAVYTLVIGKNGSKLKQSPEDEPSSLVWTSINQNTLRLTVKHGTLAGLAVKLQDGQQGRPIPALGRPVIDKTGLVGRFDYTLDLEWEIGSNGKRDPNATSIIAELERQLGLRLEPQTVSLDNIVIDSVQKPTAN